MKSNLKDNVSFAGDKLRVQPNQIHTLFSSTCEQITRHLKDIFKQPSVHGTNTILMVGGFSESKMLQSSLKTAFPGMRFIIPNDAGLAVLKGAVIFGHHPTAIASRVSKCTYGMGICKPFKRGKHPETKLLVVDGEANVKDIFDKHVEMGQEVEVGKTFEEKSYVPTGKTQRQVAVEVFTSDKGSPTFVDEDGCSRLGKIDIDMSDIDEYEDRGFVVKMIYGDTELGVEAKVLKTDQVLNAKFDFLG